ncbi:MAG: hypothetical protein NTW86_31305, partial [Candidatus Sumerlaeota bacterium]|nr:hypothetical protein [Candidatus Sumerlaeota bacterium]
MRFIRWAAALAAVLGLAACVTPQPQGYEPQIIRVNGRAHNDELAALEQQLTNPPEAKPEAKTDRPGADWARRTVTAAATGSPPSSFPSKETRRLMAKREAVGKAWRDLAQQIERLQIPGGQRVGAYTETDPRAREAVEQIIHNADI